MDALIATHGRPELLKNALIPLLEAAEKKLLNKIVLVENGGDYGAKDVCKSVDKSGKILFLRTEEGNKSNALNHGLPHCEDGLIFMTDDDIEIDPRILESYKRASSRNPQNAYFGGPTQSINHTNIPDYLLELMPASAKGWQSTQEGVEEIGLFIGFNWAAYKRDLIAEGGFNPDYGPGGRVGATGQESEMQFRLRDRGLTPIYLPEALVSHVVPEERSSLTWLLKRSYRQGIEKGIKAADRDPKEAVDYWKTTNRSILAKGFLLYFSSNQEMKTRNAFHRHRLRGFKKGIDLRLGNKLSRKPYPPFN